MITTLGTSQWLSWLQKKNKKKKKKSRTSSTRLTEFAEPADQDPEGHEVWSGDMVPLPSHDGQRSDGSTSVVRVPMVSHIPGA